MVIAPSPSALVNSTGSGNAVDQSQVIMYIGYYAASLLVFSCICLLLRCVCGYTSDEDAHLPADGDYQVDGHGTCFCRCCTVVRTRYLLLIAAGFGGWFSISVSFSLMNKLVLSYLENGVFKVPFFITCVHFVVKFLILLVWINVKPVACAVVGKMSAVLGLGGKCFHAGSSSELVETPSCYQIWTKFIPIGIFTGLDISFTNLGLQVGTVSLVTLTKGGGIFMTLFFGVVFGLQRCTRSMVGILCVIALGMSMSLWKEPDFNFECVAYATTASAFSALRWTFTQTMMQHHYTRVDMLILYSAPSAALIAALGSFANESTELGRIAGNTDSIRVLLLITVLGGILTLFLLAIEVLMVQITSALTLDVGAKIKDMSLIILSILVYPDKLRPVNALGFAFASIGLVGYGMLKREVKVPFRYDIKQPKRGKYLKVGMDDSFEDDDLWSAEIEDEEFGLGDIELNASPNRRSE